MNAKTVAEVLGEIALLRELKGDSAFKVRAYANAARTIESLDEDIEELVQLGKVSTIKGVGKSISQKITELVQTGQLQYLEGLRQEVPGDLKEWVKIPGLGPKKIRAIVKELDISSMDELAEACRQGRLSELEGFGEKTEEKILKGIEQVRSYSGRFLQSTVRLEADRLLALVRSQKQVIRAEVCGSVRRGCETSKDVDILASAHEKIDALMDLFTADERVIDVIARGPTKCSVRLMSGLNVDLRVVSDTNFPFALQYFTGSKAHNVALRMRTVQLGYKLNEYALTRVDDASEIPCEDEEDIYKALGLNWIPPEIREDSGELEAAEEGDLPDLVELKDLKGAIHCHTKWTDGNASIEEMVSGAIAHGWRYILISDHSKSAGYAGGLSAERVQEQQEEIDALQQKYKKIDIVKGIEVDIQPDGQLDYPDDVLESFDLVIAAVHSHFTLSEAKQTERMIRAVEHPSVNILAHPTGRLLLNRDPYPVKTRRVIDAAIENNVAIEINSQPDRLDLDWQGLRYGLAKGLKTVISTDAHAVEELKFIGYGLRMARKGWCTKKDVLNTLPLKQLLKQLGR